MHALPRLLRALALALLPAVLPGVLRAQTAPPTTLVADRVEITADGGLIASGMVEVRQGTTRLTAGRIAYDGQTGALRISGPLVLSETGPDSPRAVILADAAELSDDLREGVLLSARLMLEDRLQLTAARIERRGGRLTRLSNTLATSCEVCAARPRPLWAIRARSVTHDSATRMLYFDNAVFQIMGVPVAWLPHLRLPDPTVRRATGLLSPELRLSDEFGLGLKQPVFIALDAQRDLRLTPYLARDRTTTLEARYRQALRGGGIEINGALSQDDLRDGLRAYLDASGTLALPRDLRLGLEVQAVSDVGYLYDYDYFSGDRLRSGLRLERTRADSQLSADLSAYRSLRAAETGEKSIALLGDAEWLRRFSAGGGDALLRLRLHGHGSAETDPVRGRDLARLSASLGWTGGRIGPAGQSVTGTAALRLETTETRQDPAWPDPVSRAIPSAAVTLRWPLIRTGRAVHLLEPVAELAWTAPHKAETPADESLQPEFDEGNLFAPSRFPADDRIEQGLRANLGLGYTRNDPAGWQMSVGAGRILRATETDQFDGVSTLEGRLSDWLTTYELTLDGPLALSGRAHFDDAFAFSTAETRLAWRAGDLDLSAAHLWLRASPAEDRPRNIAEWHLGGTWQIGPRWSTDLDWRYDIASDRSAYGQIGVQYRANCVTLDLSLRRRFTATGASDPGTQASLGVLLAGLGGSGDGTPRPRARACLRASGL